MIVGQPLRLPNSQSRQGVHGEVFVLQAFREANERRRAKGESGKR
jgi:hypothetical protein